ncbi:MAG: DegQ family serine endoprotease [Bdellovibrionota bacterium]
MKTYVQLGVMISALVVMGSQAHAADLWKEGKNFPGQRVNTQTDRLDPKVYLNISEAVRDAVVNVSSTRVDTQESPFGKGSGGQEEMINPFDDLFEKFFGRRNPFFPQQGQGPQATSLGSGFVLSEEGYILTNNHVVEKAKDITVTFADETERKATLVGRDPKTDVALLKVDPGDQKLKTVILGDSDAMKVGEVVVAIGNPFGLSHSVTQGIISAKERSIGIVGQYDDFIQTDASINPGNSGGPLLNLYGEVIGINTAILASGQGIGFAIPINLAKQIILKLKEDGKVVRGQLGVMVQKVTNDMVKALGLSSKSGALVAQVVKGSPAQAAGIEVGDVIVSFDGQSIGDWHKLPLLVAGTKVGKKVEVELLRDGKSKKVTVKIAKLDDDQSPQMQAQRESLDDLGLMVEDLDAQIRKALGLDKDVTGVVISVVEPDSDKPAYKAGLQRGDVISQITVDKKKFEINTVADYQLAIKNIGKKKRFLMLIVRGGRNMFVTLVK